MPKKSSNKRGFGGWAFLIGVILAIVLGLFGSINSTWLWVLVVIGLIVGFLNVTEEETHPFLMSGVVLIIASALGGNVMSVVPALSSILDALLAIFVPAIMVVAIKHVFSLAKH